MRRFLIAIAIFFVGHIYIWWRLVEPLPSPTWEVGTVMLAAFAPSFPLMRRYARRLPRESAKPWVLLGYMWFSLATYLLLAAVAMHLAVAFGVDPGIAAIAGIAIAVAIVLGGFIQVARGPLVRHVKIPIRGLPVPSFTIAHLTDVHIGPLLGQEFAETLVRRVNALHPDLIVLTGDTIDGWLHELARHIEPLRDLRARHGVYHVTGNHEFYWDAESWLDHLRSLGMTLLRNEHVTVADTLVLAGVDDTSSYCDVPRAVAGRDPDLPLVLLAHRPHTVTSAAKAGVDLQLSGHTHGGQLLPLGWLARLWDPQVGGLGRFGSTWLYVSDGTGFWGPPVRVGTRCEIAAITLVPAD